MSLRRYDDFVVGGYGVVGDIVIPGSEIATFNVEDVLKEIPYDQSRFITEQNLNVTAMIVKVFWRAKIVVNNADLSKIKTYDAEIGKTQYGRYVCKYREYISDLQYMSFASILSPLYVYSAKVDYPSGEEDELPCDEPPVDLGVPPVIALGVTGQTDVNLSSNLQTSSVYYGWSSATPASTISFYPQIADMNYNFGVTYNFYNQFVTAEQQVNPFPVVISL